MRFIYLIIFFGVLRTHGVECDDVRVLYSTVAIFYFYNCLHSFLVVSLVYSTDCIICSGNFIQTSHPLIIHQCNSCRAVIDFGFAKKVPYTTVDQNSGEVKVHSKTFTLCGTPGK